MIETNHAALLLIGHGSARNKQSRVPTDRLAEMLRGRGLFAEVQSCFLKEPPSIADALAQLSARVVIAVPNLAGEGPLVRIDIPRLLGLSDGARPTDGRIIHYTRPVGSHPRLPELIRRRTVGLMEAHGLARDDVCLLLVGHGSSRPGGAATTAQTIAAALRDSGAFGEVALAYLEQAPFVTSWPALIQARTIIVAPLLIAEGLHGSEDLPPLFGLAPGQGGPAIVEGRRVWLCRGIGADPEIAELILDRVQDCGLQGA